MCNLSEYACWWSEEKQMQFNLWTAKRSLTFNAGDSRSNWDEIYLTCTQIKLEWNKFFRPVPNNVSILPDLDFCSCIEIALPAITPVAPSRNASSSQERSSQQQFPFDETTESCLNSVDPCLFEQNCVFVSVFHPLSFQKWHQCWTQEASAFTKALVLRWLCAIPLSTQT